MLDIKLIKNTTDLNKTSSTDEVIDFLFIHLGQFGDTKQAIRHCLDYAFSPESGKGGFLLNAYYENKLVGVLIMNNTGMKEYIPENILVYIAVDSSCRGKGFGKEIIEKAIELTKGAMKLHVEYDNPAIRLYERLGFENKYAEMRYIAKNK
ncbi:MAG: GNAT family N-acetyltransferase [Bacteroidetes bacterium]|nr:GNAT family N-acetyltransferase [Bacteroidota bacterium]